MIGRLSSKHGGQPTNTEAAWPMKTRKALLTAALVCSALPAHAAHQKRDLPRTKGHYILVLPKDHDPKKTYDVVIALHGAGDTAENFARFWAPKLRGRETVLAVPEAATKLGRGFTWGGKDVPRILETLDDVVKHYGVDRKQVLLAGFSAGCAVGFYAISKRPTVFTCFGGTGFPIHPKLIDPKGLEKAAKTTAVYFSIGKKDPNHHAYMPTVNRLKKLKFNLAHEDPASGHRLTSEQCKHMLAHFDASKAKRKGGGAGKEAGGK